MTIKTITITKRTVEDPHPEISSVPYSEYDLEIDGKFYGYFQSVYSAMEYSRRLFEEEPHNVVYK